MSTTKTKQNIPKGWQQAKLGDIASVTTGNRDANHGSPDGQYPFFTCAQKVSHIDNFSFDTEAVLVAGNGDFNVKYYNGKFDAYQRTYVLSDFQDTTGDFLYQKIQQALDEIIRNNQGSSVKFIKKGDLTDYRLLLPSLLEQKKIAEILSAVDEEIQKTDEIISATEKLKRGLMQKLLASKTKRKVRLGDYVDIRSGDTPSGFEFDDNGTYPFYKVEDMNKSQKYLIPTRYYFNSYNKPLMPKGMVVFPKRGAAIHTNKVRILSTDSYFDTNVMGLTTKKGLNNEYLYYFLTHIGLAQFADTTSVAQINNKHIEPLEIPLPDEKEQKNIADILSVVDEKVAVNNKLKEQLIRLKKGLMQDLLSGSKRVNI